MKTQLRLQENSFIVTNNFNVSTETQPSAAVLQSEPNPSGAETRAFNPPSDSGRRCWALNLRALFCLDAGNMAAAGAVRRRRVPAHVSRGVDFFDAGSSRVT